MRISTSFAFDRATQGIQDSFSRIGELQSQVGSGKKLLRPSDAPREAARLVDLDQAVSRLDQFERNRVFAEQQLDQTESNLSSVTNLLQRVRDLVIQSNSGVINNENRQGIRSEIEQRFEELLDYANARDANGDYLYAGGQGASQPFTKTGGTIVYGGDQTSNALQISPNRSVTVNQTGYDIFQSIRNGNGSFYTDIVPANTGTGEISIGSVVNPAAFQKHDFSIVFSAADTFDVINNTTGATVLAAQPYLDGENIAFNGVEVQITGVPQAGDQFTVGASRNQDVFQTLQNLINTLSIIPQDTADEARINQGLDRALADIDQALGNVLAVRTEVGARLNSIETSAVESENIKLQFQQIRSDIEDLDIVAAVSQLEFELTTLEAVQRTFSRVQQLSLFDYLR